VGGGVEWMFLPHWSTFLEGNYMDFGSESRTVVAAPTCAAGCPITAKGTEANVLVGVNYRF
jgi:opacity protein-like surface antigen